MKKQLTEFWKKYRLKIAIIGGLLLSIVLFFVLRGFFRDDKVSTDVNVDDNNLTYDKDEYGIIADSLEQALDTAFPSQDKALDILKNLQTEDDIKATIKAFGTRTMHWFGIPQGSKTLIGWMQEKFSQSNLQEARQYFNQLGVPL